MDDNMHMRVLKAAHTDSLTDLIRTGRMHSLCSEAYADSVVRRAVAAVIRELASEQAEHNQKWQGDLAQLPAAARAEVEEYLKGYFEALDDVAIGHLALADTLDL